jgi:hypothetical protein
VSAVDLVESALASVAVPGRAIGASPAQKMCRRDAESAEQRDFSAPGAAQTSSVSSSSTRPLVARKLALRVSGARVGDSARPTASGPAAASATSYGSRVPRLGLRVHARGTLPPQIDATSPNKIFEDATRALAAVERDASQDSLLGDLCVSAAHSLGAQHESVGPEPPEQGAAASGHGTDPRAPGAAADHDAYPWEGQP